MLMDNTVGSNLVLTPFVSYNLGLWCADGYSRTSSVGFCNTNLKLLNSFLDFLNRVLGKDMELIRLRIYCPVGATPDKLLMQKFKKEQIHFAKPSKSKLVAYHLYVNDRSLLCWFKNVQLLRASWINTELLGAFFAGRFDGDGSIDANLKRDCRIVYGNYSEAFIDQQILSSFRTSIYYYRKAGTYCLYVSMKSTGDFVETIKPFSEKIKSKLPRID